MEGGAVSSEKRGAENEGGASYRYWVREVTQDAAPLPAPRKLAPEDISNQSNSSTHLGSAWNRAGTWEEKNLNNWANARIKELLVSVGALQFSTGRAEIAEVTRCMGDAFLVTVRNKKRVGYTYEISLRVKGKLFESATAFFFPFFILIIVDPPVSIVLLVKSGEWRIGEEKKKVKSHLDIPEFSFGEVDDLEVDVRLGEDKDLQQEDKVRICQDMKLFLNPLREKLVLFEKELKER